MDSSFDLPDSTDWLSTSLPAFEPLEAALRCEVCKEFYANPVITSCSHTFCSICIRRCIATDGKCPSCKTSCSSDKLLPNIVVRDVVMRFQEARPKVLELARAEKEAALESSDRKKRKLDETDIEEDDDVRQTRSRRARIPNYRNTGMEDAPIEIPNSEDEGDEDFMPDGMAKCPICRKSMKTEQVYNHLDVCPGQNATQERSSRSRTKPAFTTALSKRPKETSPPPERQSQLNYAMMNEKALRKKLQEIGIPNWGSKDLMKRRHIEWLNIYNSNCDADNSARKSKKQLLRELDEWEQTQGGRAENKESKVMRKDFDGDGHARSHKNNFDELIAQARKVRNTKKASDGEEASATKAEVQPSGMISQGPSDPPGLSPYSMVQVPTISHNEELTNAEMSSNIIQDPQHSIDTTKAQEAPQREHYRPDQEQGASTDNPPNHISAPTEESVLNPFQTQGGTRKVPMFSLPEEPTRDVDNATIVQ